jgi:hypothetical protein
MNDGLFFQPEDLSAILPAPGYYRATITAAGFRTSSRGNRMLHLALRLQGVCPAFQSLADYFVLQGGSPEGRAVARRRLVRLYHACGLHPEDGDEILPSHLIDASLEVKLDHVEWANQIRLRVLAYQSAWPPVQDLEAGFGDQQQGASDAGKP